MPWATCKNLFGSVALAGLLLWTMSCGGTTREGPDVIFLTADTLRLDHISCYSEASPVQTPAIDALAAESILFENALSPISVTGPAFCTLMTGRNPGAHGVVMNFSKGGRPLNGSIPTLAQQFRQNGYATAAFVSGFTLRPDLGLDRGFDRYDAPDIHTRRFGGKRTVDRSLDWLGKQDDPAFLWVHLYDPHGPWDRIRNVPSDDPAWGRREADLERMAQYQIIDGISDPFFYTKRYAAAVAFMDFQIGRFIEGLRAQKRFENALIVFMADHGESFTERELWFDHGTTPFIEQLQVPLLLKPPDQNHPPRRDERLAGLADIAPTVTRLLGHRDLPGGQGESLLEGPSPGHAILVGESSHCKADEVLSCRPRGPGGKIFSARDDRWTLIYEPRSTEPRWTIFDRSADPRELTPQTAEQAAPALRKAIESMMKHRAAAKLDKPATGENALIDPAELEALRALGYGY